MKKLNIEQQKLVENNINLVYYIVDKYFYMNYEYYSREDLVSEGFICLCRCALFFDSSKGVKFSWYACRCIKKHLVRVLQDHFKKTFETYDIVDYQENFSYEDKYNLYNVRDEIEEFLKEYLTEKQIKVLIRYYFDGKNTQQIAEEVGYKDKNSVNTIRIKILKKLRNNDKFKNEYIKYFM